MSTTIQLFKVISPELVAKVKAEVDAFGTSLINTFEHAHAAGLLLREAKKFVPHGEREQWYVDTFGISERVAQNMVKISRRPLSYYQANGVNTVSKALAIGRPKPEAKKVHKAKAIAQPIGKDGSGAVWAKGDKNDAGNDGDVITVVDVVGVVGVVDVGDEIKELIPRLSSSLSKLISDHNLWNHWDGSTKAEMSLQLVNLVKQAITAANLLKPEQHEPAMN